MLIWSNFITSLIMIISEYLYKCYLHMYIVMCLGLLICQKWLLWPSLTQSCVPRIMKSFLFSASLIAFKLLYFCKHNDILEWRQILCLHLQMCNCLILPEFFSQQKSHTHFYVVWPPKYIYICTYVYMNVYVDIYVFLVGLIFICYCLEDFI